MDQDLRNDDNMRDAPDGGHVFHTDERGVLTSYEGPGGEVKVPEGVTCIGTEAFAFCSQVTGAVLPEGVHTISKRAFCRSGIRTISLPESLYCIEKYAFFDTPLEEVWIPDQAANVRDRAFAGARHLRKVKLPKGMIRLDPGFFSGCSSLKEVILPEGLEHIEGSAFQDCASLEHIDLPEGLVSVWTKAFCGCSSLKEIRLGDNVEAVGYAAFQDCPALERVRIPKDLNMKEGNAFGNAGRNVLYGPGTDSGLIVTYQGVRYYPGQEKVAVPEGLEELPYYVLESLPGLEILDVPGSLAYYSWSRLAGLGSLRQIVTDRDAPAAEIALMLDIESVDRDGQRFVYRASERPGEWITEPDDENDGVRILGCRGRIGHTDEAGRSTVIIPGEIDGRPVTSIGRRAFEGYDSADAFYIPDSVRRIESRAFADNEYCRHCGRVFVRMPEGVKAAGDAFAGTDHFTKESIRKAAPDGSPAEPERDDFGEKIQHEQAVLAADDPAIGTGTCGRPALQPNIWQYFDRLSREERIRELTHSFRVSGKNDGAGWASVTIELDGENTWFSISYVGSSPAALRQFAEELEDGENEVFGWESEPGWFPWLIQRRGGILYVTPPTIERSFFIPRGEFLRAAEDLTGDW